MRTLIVLLAFLPLATLAQTADSLLLNNGNILVGEAKSMDRGILTFETPYSDSDFKIEWEKISYIKTSTYFLITLSNGQRFNGTIQTTEGDTIQIFHSGTSDLTRQNDIVFLKSIDDGFWSQLYASVDLGYSITKANNLRQGNVGVNIGFLDELWSTDMVFNLLSSTQDEIDPTQRMDGSFSFRYYLPSDWFAVSQVTFLSNTEQEIDQRWTYKLGIGHYLIHTNQTYWSLTTGGAYNNEKYTSGDPIRNSGEAFLGSQLNMFDIGDLNLFSSAAAYPSITEKGRWRFDFSFDAKYDLPKDFYIKFSATYNYDNQPVAGTSDSDYVYKTAFGWEL